MGGSASTHRRGEHDNSWVSNVDPGWDREPAAARNSLTASGDGGGCRVLVWARHLAADAQLLSADVMK